MKRDLRNCFEDLRTPSDMMESAHIYADFTPHLLHQLMDMTPDCILILQDGYIRYFNRLATEVSGYPPDALLTTPVELFIHPDDRNEMMQRYDALMQGRLCIPGHPFRWCDADGVVHWSVSHTVVTEWRGRTAVLTHLTDTTDRIHLTEAIHSAQTLLKASIDAIPDIVGILLPDHRIVCYNRAGYDFLKRTPSEVIGRRCYELIGRTDQCDNCATSRAIASKKLEEGYQFLPGFDLHFYCRSNPIINDDGKVVYIVEILQDVTRQKNAEFALVESEKRYRRLAENAEDVIFCVLFKPTVHISYVNPAITRMSGYTPEEFYSDPDLIKRIIHPEDWQQLEVILSGEYFSSTIIIRWIHRNGEDIWAEHTNVAVYDDHGELIGIESIARDITEKKKAEEVWRGALSQIDENMYHLSILNDQIRNPLTVIMGFVEMEAGAYADQIIEQVISINRIIMQLDLGMLKSASIRAFLDKQRRG